MSFTNIPSPSKGVTLCGCGWLGNHVVDALPTTPLLGTTRTKEKAEQLKNKGVTPLIFSLGDEVEPLVRLSADNAVIINIPPGRRKAVGNEFVSAMLHLINAFLDGGASAVIFISTTSVFGDAGGELTTSSATHPQTDSGHAHQQIEEALLAKNDERIFIVRLAGLVGATRHPAKYLAGRTLDKGEQAVNLVHVDDVVKALQVILASSDASRAIPSLLQLCSLSHPRRDEYYTWATMQLGLEAPHFSAADTPHVGGKKIISTSCWHALGLTPRYASPYDML